MVVGETPQLSWSGWDRPCQCLHRIPRVHPWGGISDLVGSCPAFKDVPETGFPSMFGGCAQEVILQTRETAVFLIQLQFPGI